MNPSRRALLAGASAAALLALGCRGRERAQPPPVTRRLGPLSPSPEGLVALPAGFRAVVLQRAGDPMDDGARVPRQPDGMTCHALPDGRWALLRNHELGTDAWLQRGGVDPAALRAERPELDPSLPLGGVARIVLDPAVLRAELAAAAPVERSAAVVASRLLLSGTDRNCAGGRTAEGWISCEESDEPGFGWAYRVRADDERLLDTASRRLTSWGRFLREGVALDADTGVVVQTEDHPRGLLYRHVPADPRAPFGPGRLQALAIPGVRHTDRHLGEGAQLDPGRPLVPGDRFATAWVDVPDPAATTIACRDQLPDATRFTRAEGVVQDPRGDVWFVATTAGPVGAGQLWRLDRGLGALTLEREVTDRAGLSMPDNLVIAPWGDLVLCEDNYSVGGGGGRNHLRAIGPDGGIYDLARSIYGPEEGTGPEFAGACFSPDGEVLFVNLMHPVGATLAISGPWPRA